jgi:Pilin (bacterial filament)
MTEPSRDVDPARRPPGMRRMLRIAAWVVPLLVVVALLFFFVHESRVRAVRGQVASAIATADSTRMAVAVYHARTGGWPLDNAAAGVRSPSAVRNAYVENVHIETGMIVITLGGKAGGSLRGARVDLTPYVDADVVRWHCRSSDVPARLLPENCR